VTAPVKVISWFSSLARLIDFFFFHCPCEGLSLRGQSEFPSLRTVSQLDTPPAPKIPGPREYSADSLATESGILLVNPGLSLPLRLPTLQ